MVYVGAAVVVVVIVVAAIVLLRRRSAAPAEAPDTSTPAAADSGNAPMTGLEAALAQVTDREGRPIGERLDAETEVVDELRVPDDTGPLLRRALDRLEHDDAAGGDGDPEPRDTSRPD